MVHDVAAGTDVTIPDTWIQAWSPDGRMLLVGTDPGDGEPVPGLFVINADGTGLRQVTDQQDGGAVWSGDGEWLAFTRPGPGYNPDTNDVSKLEIWVVRTDGTGARRVFSGSNNFDWQHP